MKAYVTLLSSKDYLPAVLILNTTLRLSKAKYPLLVALTEDVYCESIIKSLDKNSILYRRIRPLQYTEAIKKAYEGNRVLNTASKLEIFTFTEYDKLVYIDADCMILHNIDDLFGYPDGSILCYEEEPWGCTSLFVIEPKKHDEIDFLYYLLKTQDCFDGNLIGKLWFHVQSSPAHQIPPEYQWVYQPTFIPEGTRMIHFCNETKPWLGKCEENVITKAYNYFLRKLERENLIFSEN